MRYGEFETGHLAHDLKGEKGRVKFENGEEWLCKNPMNFEAPAGQWCMVHRETEQIVNMACEGKE